MTNKDYAAVGKQADVFGRSVWAGFGIVITLVVAAFFAVIINSGSVAAQSAANTLRVSPVRTDVVIQPGESKEVQVTLTNITGQEVTVRASANDFVAGDESGTPSLILDETEFAPSHSLKRFMSAVPDVTIPANSSVTVRVPISVPVDALAGGYFGAIRFLPASADSGGQVNLSASVASLILLTVPGDLIEKLNLTNFDVRQGDDPRTVFNNAEDINAFIRFTNSGNVQSGPFGKISVKRGDTVVYEVDFNNEDPRDMVLPDNARRWQIPLDNISEFGHYTVVATFTYGEDNQTIESTQSFWMIPYFVLAVALGVLVLIVGVFVLILWLVLRKKRRTPALHRKI